MKQQFCRLLVVAVGVVAGIFLGLVVHAGVAGAAPSPTPTSTAPVVPGETPPPPPNGLSGTPDATGNVSLTWARPQTPQRIDGYVVLRDGTKVGEVNGRNGQTPTDYVDTLGPNSVGVYTVESVNDQGTVGPPSAPFTVTTGNTAAPGTNSSGVGPASNSTDSDELEGSNFCNYIKQPDLTDGNRKNAEETFACTAAMNYLPHNYGSTDVLLKLFSFPLGLFWGAVILFGLIASAFFSWTLNAATYGGWSGLIATLVTTFASSADYFRLRQAAEIIGIIVLIGLLAKGKNRKAVTLTGAMVLIFGSILYFTGNVAMITNKIVSVPLAADNYTISMVDSLGNSGAKVNNYGLTVVGTYNNNHPGDAARNARRKADNQDWIIHDYLPVCQMYTGDVAWASSTTIPPHQGIPSGMTWCEALIRLEDGDVKFFPPPIGKIDLDSELKAANPAAHHVFYGKDLQLRYWTAGMTGFANLFHNGLKLMVGGIVLAIVILSLVELLLLFLASLPALTMLSAVQEWAKKRSIALLSHILASFSACVMILLTYVVESYIYTLAINKGFVYVMLWSGAFNIIMTVATVMVIISLTRKVREHFNIKHNSVLPAAAGAILGMKTGGLPIPPNQGSNIRDLSGGPSNPGSGQNGSSSGSSDYFSPSGWGTHTRRSRVPEPEHASLESGYEPPLESVHVSRVPDQEPMALPSRTTVTRHRVIEGTSVSRTSIPTANGRARPIGPGDEPKAIPGSSAPPPRPYRPELTGTVDDSTDRPQTPPPPIRWELPGRS